ncbi:MAG: Trm112 family protein [Devosiaceae bacterium]|nr:Trm112 family protein [Devosiaceae bacterium MH13]
MTEPENPEPKEPNAETAPGDPQPAPASPRSTVDRKLLDMLVCPVTKSVLHYDHDRQELVSFAAKVAYPIRDSIPIMLIEEARELDDAEIAKIKSGKG